MGHYTSYENVPQKEEKGAIKAFNPQNGGPRLGFVSPGNSPLLPEYTLPSQDTSSLPSPLPYFPSPSLSSLVVWADPQSISPQRQPQKNNVYCIYNIYMVLMVLSHTLPTYITLKMHPLHCAIHLKSSLQPLCGERWMVRVSFSPCLAPRQSVRIISADRTVQSLSHIFYSSYSSVEWLFAFLQ